MVSIFAPHFFNWTKQLKDSGHEVYWLDVFDSNTKVEKLDFAQQIIGWRYKVKYPGRYLLKQKTPRIYKLINKLNERNLSSFFEQKLLEVQPDVVQSFVMNLSCFPILNVMKKNPEVKWIYSSWGSDLYAYKDKVEELEKIKMVLTEIDFMFADCYRDFNIATSLGFRGNFLGVFPGGGGYDFKYTDLLMKPFEERNTIIIKGYQGKHGRCIQVLKAISQLEKELKNYCIIVFGANKEVKEYMLGSSLKEWKNLEVLERISNSKVLKIMGKSLLYIGNSLSDGMPNTLLEAVMMGVFPIQSNPGGATAELIEDGVNGLLINNPEDIEEIKILIMLALNNRKKLLESIHLNNLELKPSLERERVKNKVIQSYKLIEKAL